MGRKYGRLAYGRYTYDLWPSIWIPIPKPPVGEIWIPDPGVPAPIEAWSPAAFGSTEIWTPITFPTFGPQDV